MKSSIQRTIMILAICLSAIASYGQVSQNDLADKIQKGIEGNIPKIATSEKPNSEKQISENIAQIGDAVRDANMKSAIDDQSANWIVDGVVSYCSDLGVISSQTNVASIVKVLKRRLDSVDNSKVHRWMALSKSLMANAKSYRQEYRKYIVAQFAASQYIELRLDSRSKGTYLGSYSLTAIANILANDKQSVQETENEGKSTYDATNNGVDSKILTLSFVKLIQDYFAFQKSVNDFSYSNVLSLVFDEKYSYLLDNELTFTQAQPYIEKQLNQIIEKKGETLLVFNDHIMGLYGLIDIREPGVHESLSNTPVRKDKEASSFAVKFKNYPDYWKELTGNNE